MENDVKVTHVKNILLDDGVHDDADEQVEERREDVLHPVRVERHLVVRRVCVKIKLRFRPSLFCTQMRTASSVDLCREIRRDTSCCGFLVLLTRSLQLSSPKLRGPRFSGFDRTGKPNLS